jgi:hypothetical protein
VAASPSSGPPSAATPDTVPVAPRRRSQVARTLPFVLVASACLPLIVAAASMVTEEWIPVSDEAVIAVFAHDVLSWDPPLVGMPSTAGDGEGNHPGPMLFWALAPLDGLTGSAPWSFPVSMAVVGVVSIVAIGWATHRRAGNAGLVLAVAVTAVMGWSLGRKLLVDVWNPHAAVMPFLASLFLAWSVAAGWSWGLPLLAVGLSFVAQTHVVYVPFAVVGLLAGVLVVARGPRPWPPLLTALGALLVTWALPLVEQATEDPGNLTLLADAAGGEEGVGYDFAARAAARTVGVVPLFARPARWTPLVDQPLPAWAAVAAVVVIAALVVLGGLAWRRRDRTAVAAAGVALLGLAVGFLVLARMPLFLGIVVPQWRYYFLWPLGAFTWFALLLLVVRAAGDRTRAIVLGVAGVVFVVAVVAIPFADSPEQAQPPIKAAIRQLAPEVAERLEGVGPVVVSADGTTILEAKYGWFQELRRRGIDTRVARQDEYLGETHAGGRDLPRLVIVGGASAPAPAGGELLAEWDATTPEVRAAFDELTARALARYADPLLLTPEGRRAVDDPPDATAAALADLVAGRGDVEVFFRSGALLEAYERGWYRDDTRGGSLAFNEEWSRARAAVDGRLSRVYLVPAT